MNTEIVSVYSSVLSTPLLYNKNYFSEGSRRQQKNQKKFAYGCRKLIYNHMVTNFVIGYHEGRGACQDKNSHGLPLGGYF